MGVDVSQFVHLHLHSGFSLLDGACGHDALAKKAVKSGMPAIAVTDHGNLFGAMGFYEAATKAGVKPIIGCEMYVSKTTRTDRDPASGRPNHLILLCENETGYRNLVKLVSKSYLEGFYYKPRIDKDLLAEHSEGLIGLSACLNGEVSANLLAGRVDEAQAAAGRFEDIFGKDRFFLEIHDHGLDKQRATVLERGSSHMRYQTRLVLEEHERFGWKLPFTHPGVYDKELQEYEETDYIAVPSLFVKRTFLEEGIPESKLLHNPFGVDLANFNPIPKEDKTFRIIHCGNITFQKGVHYLLQAFSELKLPDAELWLIGYMSDEIRPFLKKWDNGRIFHKGPYPQRELYKYYSQGSVFCLASIQEGLAQVIPQAMACGLPVICTTNTGGEDMVRNGQDGFIVPIRDVDALKEKLILLYEDSQLRKSMGESARERVSGRFSWDHYGENAVRHYREILALKAGRQARPLS